MVPRQKEETLMTCRKPRPNVSFRFSLASKKIVFGSFSGFRRCFGSENISSRVHSCQHIWPTKNQGVVWWTRDRRCTYRLCDEGKWCVEIFCWNPSVRFRQISQTIQFRRMWALSCWYPKHEMRVRMLLSITFSAFSKFPLNIFTKQRNTARWKPKPFLHTH